MSEMIERVARAIWDISQIGNGNAEAYDFEDIGENALCRRQARAAIEAMRDPTREMLVAGQEDLNENIDAAADTAWRVMIDMAIA